MKKKIDLRKLKLGKVTISTLSKARGGVCQLTEGGPIEMETQPLTVSGTPCDAAYNTYFQLCYTDYTVFSL